MSKAPATESHGSGPEAQFAAGKAVLHCPRCAHESPVHGDWILLVDENAVDVHCPDCWTRLTSRSR